MSKKKLELDEKEAAALADALMEQGAHSRAHGDALDKILYKLNDPVAQCIEALADRDRKELGGENYPKDYPIGETTITVQSWVIGAYLVALRRANDKEYTDGGYGTVFDYADTAMREALREGEQK